MATKKLSYACLQAPCAYKRNKYRNLAIEYYARNSSSVLAITHARWPNETWYSYPELARMLSAKLGWEVDYRSLSRQMKKVQPFDKEVKDRIREIICG